MTAISSRPADETKIPTGLVDRLRVALYARVSSKQQSDANTVASQVEALRARISSDGFQCDPEFEFVDEGYSGGTLLRPALERLRDQAAAGLLDRLYVHSPDRLARSYPYQMLLVDELQRSGVELAFLNRAIGETPEDHLLLQVQGMMAEYERAKILERSRRGKRHRAKGGSVNVLGGAPYGYRYIGKFEGGGEARYEIDPVQAEVVRGIFAWIAGERCSIGEVCRRLKERKIASPRGKDYWDRTTVWGLLKNPAYRGEARFGKTRVGVLRPRLRAQRGKPAVPRTSSSSYDTPPEEQIGIPVPSLVDAATFEAVAAQLEENRRRGRRGQRGQKYLLQGLIVCRGCRYAFYGKPVSRSSAKGKKRDYAYYRCVGTDAYRFGGQRICGNPQCRTDLVDGAVWDDVSNLLVEPKRLQKEYDARRGKKGPTPSADHREQQVARLRQGMSRLIDAYQEGLVTKDEFEPRMRRSQERLSKLLEESRIAADAQAEQREVQEAIGHLEQFAERIREGLEKADWNLRRDIIRAIVQQVEVGEEQIRIVYRVPAVPFDFGPGRGRLHYRGRGGHPALGRSAVRIRGRRRAVLPRPLPFHHRCPEPGLHGRQHAAVRYPPAHAPHQSAVGNRVERPGIMMPYSTTHPIRLPTKSK